MESLDKNILAMVCEYLNVTSIGNICRTNKRMNKRINSIDLIWTQLLNRYLYTIRNKCTRSY